MKCVPAVLLLACLTLAAPAHAATVTASGTTVTLTAPRGQENRVTVSPGGARGIFVRDHASRLTAGAGCTASGSHSAYCGSADTALLVADLGDRDDSLGPTPDTPIRVIVRGGIGNDALRGGPGSDELYGGPGFDVATYSHREMPVSVTLEGAAADDGAPGEGDLVAEMERAVGGASDDTLVGTSSANRLFGGPGNDRIDGRQGNDRLVGGGGDDLLVGGDGGDAFIAAGAPDGSDAIVGGAGFDRADYALRGSGVVADADGVADDGVRPGGQMRFTDPLPPILTLGSPEQDNIGTDVEWVRGGRADDVLAPRADGGAVSGGPGTDVIFGSPGTDTLAGEAGFDRVVARDRARDVVRCGSQVDRVFGTRADAVDGDCEQRLDTFAVRIAPAARRLRESSVRVRVSCPVPTFLRCRGFVRATTVRRLRHGGRGAKSLRLGRGSYALLPGTSEVIALRLSERVVDLVRRTAPLRVRLAARGSDGAGPARLAARRYVLRR